MFQPNLGNYLPNVYLDWISAILIIVALIVISVAITVAIMNRFEGRRAAVHTRHKLHAHEVDAIGYNGDMKQTFVEHGSNATIVPRKPYKDAPPAQHFEGFTPRAMRYAARRLGREALVETSFVRTKANGPVHWKVKALPESSVRTETPRPSRANGADKASTTPAARMPVASEPNDPVVRH